MNILTQKISIGGGKIIMKRLNKKCHIELFKVILCAGIAPMATYEADCWSGVCYSSGCYSKGC